MKEVFELFVQTDGLRPIFKKPFKSDGYVVATNGIYLIRVKEEHCNFEVEHSDIKAPSVERIFKERNKLALMNIETDFLEQYKTIPENKYVECKYCDGTGSVYWTFDHHEKEDDCPECDGDGEVEVEDKNGEMGLGLQKVCIEDSHLNMWVFEKLLIAKKKLKEDVYLVTMNGLNGIVFTIGKCEVMLAPVMADGEEESAIDITDKFIGL